MHFRVLSAVVWLAIWVSVARAQPDPAGYPSRPITVIVPTGAQPHRCRLFRRIVGVSTGVWRRLHSGRELVGFVQAPRHRTIANVVSRVTHARADQNASRLRA